MIKKSLTFVLFFSFFVNSIRAQTTVTIPDPNFEQALIDLGIDSDKTINQSILMTDAEAVYELNVSSRNISDLTGIQAFKNLDYFLNCNDNKITSLDLSSALPNLRALSCRNNEITSFNFIIMNPYFGSLDISGNKLTTFSLGTFARLSSLNVSNNANLTSLSVQTHTYTSTFINASQNPVLKSISCTNSFLTGININECPALEVINLQENQLTNIDLSTNVNLKTLNLRDNKFTSLEIHNTQLNSLDVLFNPIINLDCSNNKLTEIFIDSGENLNLSNNDFTILYLEDLSLTNLDLSQNNSLTDINLYRTGVTNLDLSQNNNLTGIAIEGGAVTNLDLSQNPNLLSLAIEDNNNKLTSLDLSENINLRGISLINTAVTSLDLSQQGSLSGLSIIDHKDLTYLDLRNGNNALLTNSNIVNNPLLTCIFVDDAIAANDGQAPYTNWTKDDIATYRTESCDYDIVLSTDKAYLLENGEQAKITATLNAPNPTEDVTINLVASGSAAITNFTLSSNTIIIPSGQLTATVTLTANKDDMDSDKTVIIDVESVAKADELTEQQLTITINHINDAPTDIALETMSFEENDVLNELTTINVSDIDDTSHTISLVSGDGSDDNGLFGIDGHTLSKNVVFDYEAKKEYLIRIKAEDTEGLYIEKALVLSVINLNDIVITGTVANTYCGTDAIGAIQTSIEQYVSPVSFKWSSGETTQHLINKSSGIYTLTVTDGDGMVKEKEFVIETTPIYNDLKICYVTSDNVDSNNNRIYFNNEGAYNIDKVEILREGSVFNQYDLIGEMNASAASYLDISSNNQTVSYSYKVRIKDKCGNVSDSSPLHQTILLQANKAVDGSVNLNWSAYVGLAYGTYNIYRKFNNEDFQLLVSLASSKSSYNDTEVNKNTGSYTYFVAITAPELCNFTLTGKSSKSAVGDNVIKSNLKNISSTLGINDYSLGQSLTLYPNPVKDMITVDSKLPLTKVEVFSILGKRVLESKETSKINMTNLESGLYLLKIYSKETSIIKKIIKE